MCLILKVIHTIKQSNLIESKEKELLLLSNFKEEK